MSRDGCCAQPGCGGQAPFPKPVLPGLRVLSVHLQQCAGSWRLVLAENICFLSDRSDVCSMRDRLWQTAFYCTNVLYLLPVNENLCNGRNSNPLSQGFL